MHFDVAKRAPNVLIKTWHTHHIQVPTRVSTRSMDITHTYNSWPFNRTNKCLEQQILERVTGRKYDKQSISACTSTLQSIHQTWPHTTFKCPCASVLLLWTPLVHTSHSNTFIHHHNNCRVNKHSVKGTIYDTNNRITKNVMIRSRIEQYTCTYRLHHYCKAYITHAHTPCQHAHTRQCRKLPGFDPQRTETTMLM